MGALRTTSAAWQTSTSPLLRLVLQDGWSLKGPTHVCANSRHLCDGSGQSHHRNSRSCQRQRSTDSARPEGCELNESARGPNHPNISGGGGEHGSTRRHLPGASAKRAIYCPPPGIVVTFLRLRSIGNSGRQERPTEFNAPDVLPHLKKRTHAQRERTYTTTPRQSAPQAGAACAMRCAAPAPRPSISC